MPVGALAAVLAVAAHGRAREGWRAGHWLAPLCLVLGLAGSEAALAGVLLWVACEWAGPLREGTWRGRCLRCALPLAIAAAYLVAYRLAGGGARGGGGYSDPFAHPLGFALHAATRVPLLLGDALLGVRAEIAYVWPAGRLALVGLAASALVGALYAATRAAIPTDERAALRWLVPGA